MKGASPTPVDEGLRNRYLPIYIFIIVLSFLPVILFEYIYIFFLWRERLYVWFFLFLPLNLIFLLYILQFGAIFSSYLLLIICNLIYRPEEGVFKRDIEVKPYRYWNLRNIIKKWPLYVSATHPFPWLKNRFTLRFFGVKIGINTICDNSWISSEFVEIGKNVILGMGSTILSFGIKRDKFILKKIIINDDVIIGAKCVLLPGTIVEKKVKLNAHSYTSYGDHLHQNKLYKGRPVNIENK